MFRYRIKFVKTCMVLLHETKLKTKFVAARARGSSLVTTIYAKRFEDGF